jgi:hypothetical protein
MSVVVGSTKGVISLYRLDYFGKNNEYRKNLKIGNNSVVNVQKYNIKGEV